MKHGDTVEIAGIGVGKIVEQGMFMFWTTPCNCGLDWHRDWTFRVVNDKITDLEGRVDENLTKRMRMVA